MAEELEEVVEETTDQPVEEVVEKKVDESKFKSAGDDSIIKIDLSKPPVQESEEVEQQPAEKENVDVVEKVQDVVEETPVLQEVTEEEISEVEEEIEEAVAEAEATGQPLPENIQKLVEFMDETGGNLQDYVNLNRDVSKMDDSDVLDEYYRETKSHLTADERNFLLEDNFGFNEDEDDPTDIRKKKIALKEQVAKAKAHLDGQKSKYYEEIKAGSRLTPEAKKAMDFFNRYNKDQDRQNKLSEASKKTFLNKTNKLFNNKFKGFEYNVGDKNYRFNVRDVNEVKTTQSDINNFVNKFVGEDKATIEDAEGYHKSLFTGMNADAVAKHFYEQGKADAVKGQIAKDKNIDLNPRKTHGEINVDGFKVRVLGESSSDMKNRSFKIRKKK
tara:strand:+ start:3407 stop:4567 length:1161 start_codon:yes stop_codon:yes gene_type:complete